MKVLAVETSSAKGNVALFDADTGATIERELTPGFTHGRELVPAVETLLAEVGASTPDLLACGQGPGSYTGLRIGLAVVRALAFAWDRPTLGVSSLEALAKSSNRSEGHVLATVDANKGEVYWALFELNAGRPQPVEEARVGRPWDIGSLPEDTLLVGDGANIIKTVPNFANLQSLSECVPQASHVAQLAWKRYSAGARQEPELLLPVYLRPSEAEIRWSRRRSKSQQGSA